MNTAGKIIGGVALIGGGLYIYNATRTAVTAKKTEMKIAGISNVAISDGKLKGNVIIRCLNPTGFKLTISRILLDITFDNGPRIATIDVSRPLEIPAQSQKNISIPVETDNLLWAGANILVDFLSSLISKQQFTLPKNVHVKGTITGNGISVPYDEIVPIYEKNQDPAAK